MALGQNWVIEAAESPTCSPHYLHRITRGSCLFIWSDEYKDAKKFKTASKAALWAANNRMNCGFRICLHEITLNSPSTKEIPNVRF